MKKLAVLCVAVFVAIGCAPAMAQMTELLDSEMELITGQASDLGVPLTFATVDTSGMENFIHLDTLDLGALASQMRGTEIDLARTVITIDTISTETFLSPVFGPVVAKGITVDMEAGTHVRFF